MQNDSHRRRCDGLHKHQADGSSSFKACAGVSKYLQHLGASDTFAGQPPASRAPPELRDSQAQPQIATTLHPFSMLILIWIRAYGWKLLQAHTACILHSGEAEPALLRRAPPKPRTRSRRTYHATPKESSIGSGA